MLKAQHELTRGWNLRTCTSEGFLPSPELLVAHCAPTVCANNEVHAATPVFSLGIWNLGICSSRVPTGPGPSKNSGHSVSKTFPGRHHFRFSVGGIKFLRQLHWERTPGNVHLTSSDFTLHAFPFDDSASTCDLSQITVLNVTAWWAPCVPVRESPYPPEIPGNSWHFVFSFH